MMNVDIFQLLFDCLKKRPYNNTPQNVKQDADYTSVVFRMVYNCVFSH